MKITDLLSGTRILEKTSSKYNGEISVISDFSWGRRIIVNNLTQSGGILNNIWKETLKKVLIGKPKIKSCLILGLGGGSASKLVAQYWINCQIVGVDIDSKMVELGKKYLGLDKIDIDIKIQDASDFVKTLNCQKFKNPSYDLVLVDLYCGDKFPEKFENHDFLEHIKSLLEVDGVAVFNRLHGGIHTSQSMKFGKKLEKIFKKVEYFHPQANLMFICCDSN